MTMGAVPRTSLGSRRRGLEADSSLWGRRLDEDLAAQHERLGELDVVARPELPGVVPAHRALVAQQTHVLQRDRDQLGAVDRLARDLAAAQAARGPRAGEARCGRERLAVVLVDRLDQPVLVLARDRPALQAPHPRALAVALVPR